MEEKVEKKIEDQYFLNPYTNRYVKIGTRRHNEVLKEIIKENHSLKPVNQGCLPAFYLRKKGRTAKIQKIDRLVERLKVYEKFINDNLLDNVKIEDLSIEEIKNFKSE
jgi:hypothetical protein